MSQICESLSSAHVRAQNECSTFSHVKRICNTKVERQSIKSEISISSVICIGMSLFRTTVYGWHVDGFSGCEILYIVHFSYMFDVRCIYIVQYVHFGESMPCRKLRIVEYKFIEYLMKSASVQYPYLIQVVDSWSVYFFLFFFTFIRLRKKNKYEFKWCG